MTREGVRAIKEHPFFAVVDWGELENLTAKPPPFPARVLLDFTRFCLNFSCFL